VATRSKTNWKLDSQGEYPRQLGWKLDQNGKYVQHKFRLGSDLKAAEQRDKRLQAFWKRIEETHAGDDRPTWNSFTLAVAKRIADGETQIVVERSSSDSEEAYARYLHRLQRRFSMVSFIAEDEQSFVAGDRANKKLVEAQLDSIRKAHLRNGNVAEIDIARGKNGTLHQAIDAYMDHVKRTMVEVSQPKPFGRTRVKNSERLKERHPDSPLSALRLDAIEEMIDYWKNRPLVKRRGTPIRRKTAIHHIAELVRFCKWLHRTDKFEWRKPDDFDEIDKRVAETPAEVQAKETSAQVKTYSLEQLCTLYEYATPLERIVMLLGLNCGFGAAEQGTLLIRQVVFAQAHPMARDYDFDSTPTDSFVKRIRLKNKVYGEHLLWPHTVLGLKWAIERRRLQGNARPESLLFMTDKGEPFAKATRGGNAGQRFASIWGGLVERVRNDAEDPLSFPKLSFGKLRKTGGNLVRRFADGEVAGVFLCHGKPVKTDDLSEVYTNRVFGKVFKANKVVEAHLAPMFAAVDDPFGKYRQQYTSRKVVKIILALFDQGTRISKISTETGVSRGAIYRHLEACGRRNGPGQGKKTNTLQ
jgi:hypothetical protein